MPRLDAAEAHALLQAAPLPPLLHSLALRGEMRRYRKGALLMEEGDVGDTIYVIVAGRVKVFSSAASGREVTFGIYGAGDYVGEMSLDGGPRSASVVTLEPSACAVISRTTLRAHIAEHPDFALELLGRVIRRARLATHSARNFALLDVYGRLARLLDDLAVARPDGARVVEERLTHAELASRIGCSREMVSRLLKDLETGGHLRHEDRRLVLSGRLPARW